MTSESRVFPCNTCSLTFTTSELQRWHMRQPWHVSNLRRRIAELPVLSEEQYFTQTKSQEFAPERKDEHKEGKPQLSSTGAEFESISISEHIPDSARKISEKILPTQCLFCNLDSPNLDANINHMSSIHGLFIPSPDRLADAESFFGYLALIVFGYKECLYCDIEKAAVDAVQTHMRDKGHCMIKIDAESELLDFWEFSDSGEDSQAEDNERTKSTAIKLSETEMRLPSGAVINSRSNSTQLRAKPGLAHPRTKGSQYRLKKAEVRAIATGENKEMEKQKEGHHSRTSDRRLAIRNEMGLVGISESQRRALQVSEKKMKKREAVARAAQRHAAEQQPVKAMYYKTETPVYQAG